MFRHFAAFHGKTFDSLCRYFFNRLKPYFWFRVISVLPSWSDHVLLRTEQLAAKDSQNNRRVAACFSDLEGRIAMPARKQAQLKQIFHFKTDFRHQPVECWSREMRGTGRNQTCWFTTVIRRFINSFIDALCFASGQRAVIIVNCWFHVSLSGSSLLIEAVFLSSVRYRLSNLYTFLLLSPVNGNWNMIPFSEA